MRCGTSLSASTIRQSSLRNLEEFVSQILHPGRINSLTQTLIKCTAPGVPDNYQGSEIWDLHLVDPDNRGPIDYEVRRSMLAELEAGMPPEEILNRMDEGLPKLWVDLQSTASAASSIRMVRQETQPICRWPRTALRQIIWLPILRGENVAVVAPRWNVKLGGNFGVDDGRASRRDLESSV